MYIYKMDDNSEYKRIAKSILQIHPLTCQVVRKWNDINEIVDEMKVDRSTIYYSCKHASRQAYGYLWRFEEEFINTTTNMVKAYNVLSNKFKCDLLDIYTGNLSNYISPCFTFNFGEIWRDIEGFGGLYQVSNMGRVISLHKTPFILELKYYIGTHGYYEVTLYDKLGKNEKFLIHQLVAGAFIPNPNPGKFKIINHKNEIKTDNRVENLEWCDAKYNTTYGSRQEAIAKLEKPILQLDFNTEEVIREFKSISEAGRILNVNRSHITSACKGHVGRKSVGGFKWRYKDKKEG